MKQIIETIIPNRKAALIAAGLAVLLLCVSAAIPFTVSAFGKGFLPNQPQATGVETQSAGVEAQEYAQAIADREILRVEAQQRDEMIRTLQEENQILRDALALSEEQIESLLQQLGQSEAELEVLRECLELMVSEYSRKYVLDVKVSGEILGLIHYEWLDKAYVTREAYQQYQLGDVLNDHPDVGVPSIGSWTVTIKEMNIIELEGID